MSERALARRPAAARVRDVLATPWAVPVTVAGLIVVALLARILLNRGVLAPWVMPDELEYSELAESFSSGGHYLFRDQPFDLKTIYPVLIAPAWLGHSMATTYGLAKTLNAVMMTGAAIPLYFWSRRLVSPLSSVVAVALFLAIPSFMYTSELLSDNGYVPAVLLALFALALALERPTLGRQALALLLAALAAAVRVQGVVFGLVIPTAIVLKLLLDVGAVGPAARGERVRTAVRSWWPTIAALAVAALGYIVYKRIQGVSLSSGLGTAGGVTQAHYAIRDVARWSVYHFAELAFSVGVIPVSALIVLVGRAGRRETASEAERAFLAVTVAAVLWTVVQAAAFASRFSLRIEERYMISVIAVLLLALVVWLDRGLPRPAGLTAAAALLPATALLAVPYTNFLNGSVYNDTFALVPIYDLVTRLGNNLEPPLIVAGGMLVAGILFASLPRRWSAVAVPLAVFVFLAASSASVYASVKFLSRATRYAGGVGGDPSWIDANVGRGARVELLDTVEIADPHILWQSQFWNRSVRRVFGVTSQDPSLPDVTARLDVRSGRIVPALPAGSPDRNPAYAVAAAGVDVAGTQIAQSGVLALYRVRPPLRLASTTEGVAPDGWTGATAAYNGYAAAADGRIEVTLSRAGITGPPPSRVRLVIGRLRANGTTVSLAAVASAKALTIRNGETRHVTLPVPQAPFRLEVRVTPTFSPSQFGSADTRQLGVRVAFSRR